MITPSVVIPSVLVILGTMLLFGSELITLDHGCFIVMSIGIWKRMSQCHYLAVILTNFLDSGMAIIFAEDIPGASRNPVPRM